MHCQSHVFYAILYKCHLRFYEIQLALTSAQKNKEELKNLDMSHLYEGWNFNSGKLFIYN